jgi:hypothetical protein
MVAYSLVGVGVPGGVAVRPRGVGSLAGMDESAFGAQEEGKPPGDRWSMSRTEENTLPRELTLTYMDPARDYQPNTARSTRLDGSGKAKTAYDIAVVLDADEAKARAEQAHRDLWAGRNTVDGLTLPPAFTTLQPGDSLDVTLAGRKRRLNLTRVTVAPTGLVEIAAAVEQGVTWLPRTTNADSGVIQSQELLGVVPTVAHYLDLPILRAEDDDAGFYVAAGGDTGWRSAAILRETQGVGYEELAYIDVPAVIGTCQTALPAGPWAFFDEASTLDVTLVDPQQELEAVSEAAVLAGANSAVVGEEIVQFRDAVLIAPGTYRLSGFLRGRLGTDDRINGHVADERFVLLAGAVGVQRIRDGLALRSASRNYKAVSLWQDETAVTAVSFANTARSLMPLSPVHVAGSRDEDGNLTITWIRRTRIPTGWTDNADVPLGEAAERYEIDIRNAANTATLRTISTTSPTATYTAAEQIADFGARNPRSASACSRSATPSVAASPGRPSCDDDAAPRSALHPRAAGAEGGHARRRAEQARRAGAARGAAGRAEHAARLADGRAMLDRREHADRRLGRTGEQAGTAHRRRVGVPHALRRAGGVRRGDAGAARVEWGHLGAARAAAAGSQHHLRPAEPRRRRRGHDEPDRRWRRAWRLRTRELLAGAAGDRTDRLGVGGGHGQRAVPERDNGRGRSRQRDAAGEGGEGVARS